MNVKEQKTVDDLIVLIKEIKDENKKLALENQRVATAMTKIVEEINQKVEHKHMPITLEQDILQVTQQSIQKAIQESLTGYNSPLLKLVTSVVNEHSDELRKIISESFNETIKKEEFKQAIKEGFAHKVARTIISNNDGLFDKVSNELKQDTVFKSKMSIAVANVVEEYLNERKK